MIPTIGWSDETSYDWCFDGEPKGNCVAVCSVGDIWSGYTVTHSHPKGYKWFGGIFSFADMQNATVYEFGSHRAVAGGQGEKNYILTAGNNANYMGFNRRLASDVGMLRERMRAQTQDVFSGYKNGKYKSYGYALHVARKQAVGCLMLITGRQLRNMVLFIVLKNRSILHG